jgi:hemoglobin-like flavoprotein
VARVTHDRTMTPQQLELVATTAEQVDLHADRFATAFYEHLFTTWPELRELFPDDLTAQRAKLADEMIYLAEVASDFDGFADRTRQLGARHRGYGVRTDHYEAMRESLLTALRTVLGEQFTDEVEEAWTRLYGLLAEMMMDGASAAMFAKR